MQTITRFALAVLLVLTPIAQAADPIPNHDVAIRYIVTYTCTSLSAAACAISVPVPARTKDVYLVEASIEASATFTASQNLNGTVSGGTNVTPIQLNHPVAYSPGIQPVRGASVASGSTLPPTAAIAVGSTYRVAFSLEHIAMRQNSTTDQSYTLSTGNMTGDATVSIVYAVRR